MLPNNPNKQSQIHHANHEFHETASQKSYKGTCSSLECPMMVFVVIKKFSNKSTNERPDNKSERNWRKNPDNQTDICSPYAV